MDNVERKEIFFSQKPSPKPYSVALQIDSLIRFAYPVQLNIHAQTIPKLFTAPVSGFYPTSVSQKDNQRLSLKFRG